MHESNKQQPQDEQIDKRTWDAPNFLVFCKDTHNRIIEKPTENER
jgi:hypothetical protein